MMNGLIPSLCTGAFAAATNLHAFRVPENPA